MLGKNYDIPLSDLEGLPSELSLLKKMIKVIFLMTFVEISLPNASAPVLNGILFKVYKKCSKIANFFFKIFQACSKRYEIPIQWPSAQEIYFPKVSNPSDNKLSDFLTIALLKL